MDLGLPILDSAGSRAGAEVANADHIAIAGGLTRRDKRELDFNRLANQPLQLGERVGQDVMCRAQDDYPDRES